MYYYYICIYYSRDMFSFLFSFWFKSFKIIYFKILASNREGNITFMHSFINSFKTKFI